MLQNQLRDFIEDTKEKFGRDCKFITEIPIVSEDIAEPYKAAGLNSINGRIDLLIVDKMVMLIFEILKYLEKQ